MSSSKSRVLTITVEKTLYCKLKSLIAEGKVSEFANNVLKKAIKEIEENIKENYQEGSLDKNLNQEIESWIKISCGKLHE